MTLLGTQDSVAGFSGTVLRVSWAEKLWKLRKLINPFLILAELWACSWCRSCSRCPTLAGVTAAAGRPPLALAAGCQRCDPDGVGLPQPEA